jgi:RNA polymerase sigma-70 factor (ECF subfamily)
MRRSVDPRDFFEILVREHSDSVRAFLLTSVRDTVVVEDLLQESFLVAWRNLARYDRQLPFGPWVRGIAAKLLQNHRRKVGRSKIHFCDAETLSLLEQSFASFRRIEGDTFDEQLDALRGCLELLSGPQREAIRLHYEHALNCKEIGRRLDINFEAVKKHLQRGRAALERCLRTKMPAEAESA